MGGAGPGRMLFPARLDGMRNPVFLSGALALAGAGCALCQIPAFPGAEGFGAHATGGRGGDVYVVTNLNSSGTGSLRFGIENAPASGRTIVFAVSGYIPISYNGDTGNQTLRIVRNKITIAGQTAPGDGIGLKDGRILVTGDNVVIRNLRIRHGKNGGAGDCLNIDDTGHDTILDHVSLQFGTDEVISMYDSNPVDDLTLQSSIVAWGLESHSKGGLWSVQDTSCIDSLWAHNTDRNPKAQPWGLLEWVNNVTLDYGAGFLMGDTSTPAPFQANVVGSYFIHSRHGNSSVALESARIDRNGNPNFSLWLDDCLHDSDIENHPSSKSGVLNGTDKGYSIAEGSAHVPGNSYSEGDYVYAKAAAPHPGSSGNVAISVDDPLTALKKVLSDAGAVRLDAGHAGPIRDEVDALVMDDVVHQRNRQINGEYNLPVSNDGFGTLAAATGPADLDLDGMPDLWERVLGSNPLGADHNSVLASTAGTFFPAGTPSGYTRLEEYLHFKMVPHAWVGRNTAESPTSFTTDLRRFVAGFDDNPVFSVGGVHGGSVERFAADGTTPSASGPVVRFTPTPDTEGRAGFQFTVVDADGSSWTRPFAVLVADGAPTAPEPSGVRINVEFDEGTPYSGTAAAPDTGTVWNIFPERLGTTTHTLNDLLGSDGSATSCDVSVSTSGSEIKVYTAGSPGNPSPEPLMGDYAYGGTYTVTLSDLPEGSYQLYVYAHGDQADQGSTVTIDAANGGDSAVAGQTGSEYRNIHTPNAEGYSYLRFEPVVGPSGTLRFTVSSYLNGFQLVTPPEEDYFVDLTDAAGATGGTRTIPSMPGQVGSGAAPVPGETWNVFNEADFNASFPNPLGVGQAWTIANEVPLTTADGRDRAARVTVAYHAASDALTSDRLSTVGGSGTVQPGGVMERLMRNYWDRSGNGNFQRFTVGGLRPDREYLLYVYGAAGGGGQSWNARIDLDRDGTVDLVTADGLPTDALFVSAGDGSFVLTEAGEVWNRAVLATDASGELSFDSRGHLSGFQVVSYEAPQVLSQPSSLQVNPGEQASFEVDASARPEPAFQWYKDGSPIAGATGRELTVPGVGADDLGDYTVEVRNHGAAVMSEVATLGFVDPYVAYVGSFGLDPEVGGAPGVDFEPDGLANELEFFLGRSPVAVDDPESLPKARRVAGDTPGVVFEFDRLKAAAGVPFTVEFAPDPAGPWSALEDGVAGVSIGVVPRDADFDRVTVTIPTDAARGFVRLRLP
mgnify:CR=1 FL=1